MIRNYIKVAFRNLWKNKGYSAINIIGLAVGLASCLLIFLYVWDELRFDRFHEKADRIVRVHSAIRFGGSDLNLAVASDPMGAALKQDVPQVEEFTRIYASEGTMLIKKGEVFISEPRIAYVDSTFFRVFSFPLLQGDPQTALNDPNTCVISAAGAMKYFGTVDAVGKVIERNDKTAFKVTAVMNDMPSNSHFRYDVLLSMDNVDYGFGNYLSHNFHTYLLLRNKEGIAALDKAIPAYVNKYVLPQAQVFTGIESMEEFEKSGNRLAYSLMPLKDIHLNSASFPELGVNGNQQNVYIFSAVAFFILVIACINFMNLSTARSANRAKEVGIRKVLGTNRKILISQFLTESTLVSLIGLGIAILITALVMPMFNNVAGKELSVKSLFTAGFLPTLLLIPILVGLMAGAYPAFYLSGFQPISVLKGKLSGGFRRSRFRSALVVLQFAATIFLIVATIVVYNQLGYIRTQNLGFNKNQVLIVDNTYVLGDKVMAFKNESLRQPGIVAGTISSYLPVENSSRSDNTYSKESVMTSGSGFNMQTWAVDEEYLKVMGMGLKSGRFFSKEFLSDSNAMVINETTEKLLAFDDAVGKNLYFSDGTSETKTYKIIGVVKNFNFESLRQQVGPLCFHLDRSSGSVSFRINTNEVEGIVGHLEKQWKSMAPGMPFSYRFLDDSFEQMYRAEQRMGKLALIFSTLAILVACMGLFGLATFAAEQRTKEIGIRKVLGASVQGIVEMLSLDFVKLILLAAVIALPLSWWFMQQWLMNFAFRVSIQWWVLPLAALIALVIALGTVSYQAIRAALMNPVKSLRTE
ncbi:MAG: ABC transporter permease [Chitinophagaceae bacterium]